jgi:hypothetical protein
VLLQKNKHNNKRRSKMSQKRLAFKNISFTAIAVAGLLVSVIAPVLSTRTASAAPLTLRKLEVSNSSSGTITQGQGVKHNFAFTVPAGNNVGWMEFEYCVNPIPTVACVAPTGLNLTGATLTGQTGIAGFGTTPTIVSGRTLQIQRAAVAQGSSQAVTYQFSGITNPTYQTPGASDINTFYVRIRTYETASLVTIRDRSSVASAVTQNIDVTGIVRETLHFCVGVTVAGTDCVSVAGTALGIGDTDDVLSLSTAITNRDHAYFRLATNANGGSVVKYSASSTAVTNSLADGLNDIDPVASQVSFGTPGTTEQFGLGIDTSVANGSTKCSQTVAPLNGMVASASYNAANETVAASSYNFSATSNVTPVTLATAPSIVDWATCGVGFAANIAPTTPAGVYTSKFNFIAVPQY